MLYLGDWQLHRALSGNQLSWAYTFEWPIFAICGVVFWVKSVREELRLHASVGSQELGLHGAAGTKEPANPASALPGDDEAVADAYLARLKAEVQGHGRWHGIR
jgi:hypothetical protein